MDQMPWGRRVLRSVWAAFIDDARFLRACKFLSLHVVTSLPVACVAVGQVGLKADPKLQNPMMWLKASV